MWLFTVSSKISRLDEKFKHSIVKGDLINTIALKESVQSIRIEKVLKLPLQSQDVGSGT